MAVGSSGDGGCDGADCCCVGVSSEGTIINFYWVECRGVVRDLLIAT